MSRNFESRPTTSKHAVRRWLKFYWKSSTLSLAACIRPYLIFPRVIVAGAQISPRRLLVSINSVVGFADLPPFLPSAKIDIYLQPRINAHKRSRGCLFQIVFRCLAASRRRRFHLSSLARPFARLVANIHCFCSVD